MNKFAVHLKLIQHCKLTIPQGKNGGGNWSFLWDFPSNQRDSGRGAQYSSLKLAERSQRMVTISLLCHSVHVALTSDPGSRINTNSGLDGFKVASPWTYSHCNANIYMICIHIQISNQVESWGSLLPLWFSHSGTPEICQSRHWM